jgi:hypothetical protein
VTTPYLARGRRRKAPPERHPIDVKADELRASACPREDLADAIDEYLGEWSMTGLATPIIAVANHLRTLCEAAAERERRIIPPRERDRPVRPPWKDL